MVVGGNNPVSSFIAGVAGRDRAEAATGATPGTPGSQGPASANDGAAWDPDDGDDPDAAVWADPVVRPLRVRLVTADGSAAFGVPVAVVGKGDGGPILAPPKLTNADGRVRFPIDIAMEQEHEVVIAARAVPGRTATTNVKVALDQTTDVTLTIDGGIRASIQVFDPEGRPIDGAARVRKAILDDAITDAAPHAEFLGQVFGETTPRAIRKPGGLELLGLRTPDDITLFVSAPGFAPVYRRVNVPTEAQSPFMIDVKLEVRTSVVRFDVGVPLALEKERAAFSCHRVEGVGVVLAAGSDDVPAQRDPRFCVDVAPNDAQKLEVCAWLNGRIHASAEIDVPSLREGEVLDVGQVRLEMLPVVLAGHVLDQDQAPLANATIEAIGRGHFRDLAATTGADGAFALRAPSGRGPYQVSAHAAGRVSERMAGVAEPAHDLRFILDPSGSIHGSVLTAGPVDAGAVTVRAVTGGRAPFVTSLQGGGSFALTGLPRGVYTVILDGGGILPMQVTDVVVNPPEATRDGRLDHVRLRARPAQGQP